MNRRGLRSGVARLVVVAVVALGIAFVAGVSTAVADENNWTDGSSQSVVIGDGGATSVSPDSTPSDTFVPLESNWT